MRWNSGLVSGAKGRCILKVLQEMRSHEKSTNSIKGNPQETNLQEVKFGHSNRVHAIPIELIQEALHLRTPDRRSQLFSLPRITLPPRRTWISGQSRCVGAWSNKVTKPGLTGLTPSCGCKHVTLENQTIVTKTLQFQCPCQEVRQVTQWQGFLGQVTWRLQSVALKPLAVKLAKPGAEVKEAGMADRVTGYNLI